MLISGNQAERSKPGYLRIPVFFSPGLLAVWLKYWLCGGQGGNDQARNQVLMGSGNAGRSMHKQVVNRLLNTC